MTVAFVNQPWNKVAVPVRSGSVAIWTYEVARRLAKSHDVIVYSRRVSGQKKVEWHDGVQYRRFSVSRDLWLQKVVKKIPVRLLKKPLRFCDACFFVNYILQASMDLRKQGCDVVHIHNFSQFAPIVRILNPNTRVILHMHCEWLTQIRRGTIERRLRSVDRIIGCSQFIADSIRGAFPERSTSCDAIQNGVDIDLFRHSSQPPRQSANEKPTILFVGRISPEKGVHILLDAFGKVLERCPRARLEMIGPLGAAPREFIIAGNEDPKAAELSHFFDGDYVSELRDALPSKVAPNVTFLGELPYTDLAKKYDAADVFVYPSIWKEPFGLPVVEAMACGVPVVASRIGCLEEIIEDRVTGLLVDRDSVAEPAEAMLCLLSDAPLRDEMGGATRERAARRFSWERVAKDLSNLYEETLGRNR